MAISRRSGRSRFTLLLLVLTSVTVITLDFRGDGSGFVDALRETALDAFAPVQSATDTVTTPIGNVWSGIFGYDELEEENARLRAELDEIDGQRIEGESARQQNRELRALLGLEYAGDIPRVEARVVGESLSNFQLTVELDRGADDGIAEDMPVVTGSGLVGRVVQVSDERSVVLLLTDLESFVGVRLAESGEIVIAEGAGRGQDLTLDVVGSKAPIAEGEAVITSGRGDVFPPEVPVGRVSSVRDIQGSQRRVTVELAADLEQLQFVSVLQWTPPPPPPAPPPPGP